MNRTLSFLVLLLSVPAMRAQHMEYISLHGDDTGWNIQGCPSASPCRSLQAAALAARDFPGPVWIQALDAGDYGRMLVDFPQIGPNINVSPADGSVIDGGGFAWLSNAQVYTYLPALSSDNPPVGDAAALILDHDVVLRNLTIGLTGDSNSQHIGLWVRGGRVRLENVLFTGPGMLVGILVTNGGVLTTDRVTVKGTNGTAIYVRGGTANLRDTKLEGKGSGTTGLYVSSIADGSGHAGSANLERTEITQFGNGIGVEGALGPASVRLSNSVITGNLMSMSSNPGATIVSLRNNTIEGNGTNNLPATSAALK